MASVQPLALQHQQLTQADSELGTFWHRVRSATVAGHLTSLGADEIVDVGAGAGHLGGWLAHHEPGIRYRFLEPMPEVNARLIDRFGADNALRSVADIGGADAVTMLDVLEHIEDDARFLLDLHEAMGPGTHLLLTVPAHPWLFAEWDEKLGHHRRYGRASLREVVERAGFEVETLVWLFPELLLPAALRKLPGRGTADESAEFPDLPAWADRTAYGISRTTSRLGRWSPTGTSLLLVARRDG